MPRSFYHLYIRLDEACYFSSAFVILFLPLLNTNLRTLEVTISHLPFEVMNLGKISLILTISIRSNLSLNANRKYNWTRI